MNKNYLYKKNQTRATAQVLQVYQFAQSWGELAEQSAKLEKLAKRYGLIKEFKNEGVL